MTKVEISPQAQKDIKRLKRKFPSITLQVSKLVSQLEKGELPGNRVPEIDYEIYKVRLPNPDAARGKSGGFRVIYYVQVEDRLILVTVYSKTDISDLTPSEIKRAVEGL